jgi:hypothetical protein
LDGFLFLALSRLLCKHSRLQSFIRTFGGTCALLLS